LSWIENIEDTLVRDAILNENTYLSNQFQPFEKKRRVAYKTYNLITKDCEEEQKNESYRKGVSPKGEYGILEYKKDKFYRILFSYDKELSKDEKLITYGMSPNKDYLLLCIKVNNEKQFYWKKIGTTERYKITNASSINPHWLDNTTLIFSEKDSIRRSFKVSQYDLKTKVLKTIFESIDSTKEVESGGFANEVFINHGDHSTNELFVFDRKILKSVHDDKSMRSVFHGIDDDYFYVSGYIEREKQGIYRKAKTGNDWELVTKGNEQQYVDDFVVTKDFLLIKVFERGHIRLLRYTKANKKITTIQLPNDLCSIVLNTKMSDYQSNKVQFRYSTINIADRIYILNLRTKALSFKPEMCLTNETPSFESEVLNIPTTHTDSILLRITYPNADKTHKGLVLNVYGAYSAFREAGFEEFDYFLLEQGYAVAYAHVRGSRVLGYDWYNDGKLLNKQNGITDYLTCVNYLKEKGYTDKIIAYAQSAGGVIVGAALNQNPMIFDGAILDYPYLGMLKVMADSKLPLTVTEYSEFGNINEAETLDSVIKFAPYHNITKQDYPPVLLFAGTKDFQTPYWQTMKYGLKLRASDTNNPEKVLISISNTGHVGSGAFLERKNQYIYMYLFLEKFVLGN
ncbi:MAG: prolyl oligopeptidase family serine peptidase, partial [Saprospiraceae bacterium]